jgi:predicted TIM-barrel fold metal-dependent hydrolase
MTDFRRRSVLQAAIGAAVVSGAHAEEIQVKWSAGTELPTLQVPPNATDCHHHIYDSRFPVDSQATVRPGDATVADYRMLQKRIGTTRHVVVQPSTYGTDNACLLDALAAFGPTARGIAVVDTSVTDGELKHLHAAGVRGIRFNLVQAAATTTAMLQPLAERVHPLGWNIQFNFAGRLIPALGPMLAALPCPIVVDHIGHIPEPAGVDDPSFAALLKLLETGRTWIKLSGAYLDTKIGPPSYADVTKVAQAVAKAAPDRIIWGSDWPHPTAKGDRPDDAILLDLLSAWVPDEAARHKVLVTNPATLFGFPETA